MLFNQHTHIRQIFLRACLLSPSFIIDPDGRIAGIFRDVDPQTHNNDVLAALKLLCQSPAKEYT